MAELLALSDGTIVNPETGEVIEEGPGLAGAGPEPTDRMKWLASQVAFATDQAKGWEDQRKALGRVLSSVSGDVRKIDTANHRVTMIAASHVDQAKVEDVAKAAILEIITRAEAEEIIVECATGTLDVKGVKAWIARKPDAEQARLTAALISGYDRSGYPQVKPVLHATPEQA